VCRANAVEYLDQARPVFVRLNQWVNSQGLIYNNLKLRIELRSASELDHPIQGRGQGHTLGCTFFQTNTFFGLLNLHTEVKAVAVLRGLPVTLFQGVAAHELGHVWLGLHGVTALPDAETEGFCEFLAYRLYSQMGTAEGHYYANCIAQSTDPVYGNGFRRVRALGERLGFQRLVETLLAAKQLPIVH